MNIAFDMFFARTEAMRRGIGRYSNNLIRAMISQDSVHSFFYFYPDVTKGPEALKEQLQQFLTRNRIDVYHIMSPFYLFHLPPAQLQAYQGSMLQRSWFGSVRVAVTLYDVIPLVFERDYLNEAIRPLYRAGLELIRSCDMIFAISETTKLDAVRLAGMNPDKIFVIMAGLDAHFRSPAVRAPVVRSIAARYGILKPYVMCTGGGDPRKNTLRLIEAFYQANAQLAGAYQLVVVCPASAEEKLALQVYAARQGPLSNFVMTGYVSDEELLELYKGARLFVFPSLYEGFGLPVLEAMACGTPVVTSDNSSLKEISGDAACLIDPLDAAAMRETMARLLTQPKLLEQMAVKGVKQAAVFNWDETAEAVLERYEFAIRRRLAVFVPGARAERSYGDIVRQAIPHLMVDYDIDVFEVGEVPLKESARKREPAAPENEPVRRYAAERFESLARDAAYDLVVYELGDEAVYADMVPYMMRRPGVVVANGTDFHRLTLRWTLDRNRLEPYYRVLEKEFGARAHAVLDDLLGGQLRPSAVPLNRYYLGGAKAIVAIGEASRRRLARQGYANAIAAAYPLAERASNGAEGGGSDVIFASFGPYRSENWLPTAIQCFASLAAQRNGEKPRYRIAGPMEESLAEELRYLARRLGIAKQVEVTAAAADVDDARTWAKIDAAVQLDRPSNGELPKAPYAALANGVATIVRGGELHSDMPDDAVCRIGADEPAAEPLFQAMAALAGSRALRRRLGERARRYAQEHWTAARLAERIREALEAAAGAAGGPAVQWRINVAPNGVPSVTIHPEPSPSEAKPAR